MRICIQTQLSTLSDIWHFYDVLQDAKPVRLHHEDSTCSTTMSNFATYWPCFIEQSTMKYPTHVYSSKNLRQSRFLRNSDESRFLEGIWHPQVTSWYQLQSRTFQNIKLLWSPHPPALSTEVPLVANGIFLPQKVFSVSFFHLRILHWTTFRLKMEFFITTF